MGATTTPLPDVFPIGELSRATGVNIETVRYYEKIGMLAAPPRTEGGHRIYGWAHKQTLAFIRRGRELGFTLQEIRALLDLGGPTSAPCADVREVAVTHLKGIRTKIIDLRKLERLLSTTIDRCDRGTSPACPVLEILGSGLEQDAPGGSR